MNNTTGHAHDATAWLQLARRLQKQQLQQLSQLGELASQLSALVHMLQCERGASNIYLCSGGLLYTAECRAGGALVDERLALFYASLERARAVAGSALCWRIARAVRSSRRYARRSAAGKLPLKPRRSSSAASSAIC